MKQSTATRVWRTRRARLVLGVFAAAWLNLASQPCLMAMEAAPDAAPALASGLAVHGMHAPAAPCEHCPAPSVGVPDHCAGATSGCANPSPAQADSPRLKFKPGHDLVVVPVVRYPVPADRAPKGSVRLIRRADPPAGPSLNLRYCVFLK